MYLNSSQVPFYLQSRSIVKSQEMIEGHCTVIPHVRRNRNFKVLNQSGGGFFIKQVTATDPYTLSYIRREAACYLLIRDYEQFKALRAIIPELIDYDPQRYVITQRLLPNADNLSDHIRKHNQFDPAIGREIGRKLAICHGEAGWNLANYEAINLFPKKLPWVLNFYRPGNNPFSNMTSNLSNIFNLITSDAAMISALSELEQGWEFSSLIHADIKWDNIVLNKKSNKWNVVLVDWELVDIGDPCWDVAGFIHNYLYAIVASNPEILDELSVAFSFPEKIEHSETKKQVSQFFESYFKKNTRIADSQKKAFIRKTVQMAGARLLQSAFEFSPKGQQTPKLLPPMIELGKYLLLKPEENGESIFGL